MTETELDSPGVEVPRKATKNGSNWVVQLLLVFSAFAAIYYIAQWLRPPQTPLTRAITFIKQGKAAAALPILEELSRQHPENPQVYPWLAQGYLKTDRLAEGRTALDTALRLNIRGNELSSVVLSYALFYEAKGDFDEADKLFDSASRACPQAELAEGKVKLYERWAEADASKSSLNDEELHLEKAMALVNQVQEPLRSQIPHRLSDTYRQLAALAETKDKDDSLALTLLEKALAVSDEPATRMALGQIYAKKGLPEKAIQQYESVSKLDNNNLEARHRLIDLLVQTKKYDVAQVALLDLTDKEKSVENYQLLAAVDLKILNYAGAVRAYEDACDLRPKPELLKQLESVLLEWCANLTKQKKFQEAMSVKGHADRVADQLSTLLKDTKDDQDDKPDDSRPRADDPGTPPIALSFSRIWLAKGSLTPEGEVKIKNVSGHPITDLSLSAVFYDNTARRQCGSVTLPVASPMSPPFAEGASRSLYFSCPNIVKADHQLAAIIIWKNRFLKEFPVTKQQ